MPLGMKRPTLEELSAYIATRETKIDPEAFMDHYEANGWKVGKVPMVNWQAAVRTWERTERERSGSLNGSGKWSDAWIDEEVRAGRLKPRHGETYYQIRMRLK